HFDSIPNSIVKRCRGEDTWGVAPWENSSVPGSFFDKYMTKIYSDARSPNWDSKLEIILQIN
ncbi:MAG: hypothetical protein WBM86_28665, partial [Waterburya sp.]